MEENTIQNIKDATVFLHRAKNTELHTDINELMRYAGYSKQGIADSEALFLEMAEDAAKKIGSIINCRAAYIRFPLEIHFDKDFKTNQNAKAVIKFGGITFESRFLGINLEGCSAIYLFAATLGPAVDKEIQKAAKINPAMSVFYQAAGAMYIESYCDFLQNFLAENEQKNGFILKPRYSPGFGDVSLEFQKTFFNLLQCQKNLALTLNNSLIMSPEKSVTAFVGIKKK